MNLFHINESPKMLNKLINYDANEIILNIAKTELFILKSMHKKLEFEFKSKLNSKKLFPTNSVQYLGIKVDSSLTRWVM